MNHGELEILQVLKTNLNEEEYEGFLKGNIVKHCFFMNWSGEKSHDAHKMACYARELAKIHPINQK